MSSKTVTPECSNRGSNPNSTCGEHRRTTAESMREWQLSRRIRARIFERDTPFHSRPCA